MGDACGAVLAADQSTSAVGIRAAAVMAVTGVGLLTVAPGNSILTGAGWIWPPLMFALAVWMGVQLRRALTGRVRWLLYPVIAALALASVGGVTETVARTTAKTSVALAPPFSFRPRCSSP
jgi:hypothetical protein